jgi:hypothetical protein
MVPAFVAVTLSVSACPTPSLGAPSTCLLGWVVAWVGARLCSLQVELEKLGVSTVVARSEPEFLAIVGGGLDGFALIFMDPWTHATAGARSTPPHPAHTTIATITNSH